MSNADLQSLQIKPDAGDPGLAQQQTRFNTLVHEVAQWRAAVTEWRERITRYEQKVGPVRRELHAAWREWVFALDDATLQSGLARGERLQLRKLMLESAAALLGDEDDAEIAAVVSRHVQATSFVNADSVGNDTDHAEDVPPDWEQEAADAAAQRSQWAAKRRAAAAQKRERQAAQQVSQSLREVYRRLASTLHPDREPDAQQHARKTALMQQANQAYAQGNLLVLLELKQQAEQFDAMPLAAVDPRRLQHYVTVLQEQLTDLQSQVRQLESGFRAATGLAAGSGLQPRKADRLISAQAQKMRGELLVLRRQTTVLRDPDATRRWLREERKA